MKRFDKYQALNERLNQSGDDVLTVTGSDLLTNTLEDTDRGQPRFHIRFGAVADACAECDIRAEPPSILNIRFEMIFAERRGVPEGSGEHEFFASEPFRTRARGPHSRFFVS